MKKLFPLAVLALTTNVFAQNLTKVPFYFAVTEEAHAPLADKSWKKIPMKDAKSDKAYLRGYTHIDTNLLVKDAEGTAKVGLSSPTVVASKRVLRKKLMNDLYQKKILQHGDIVLSFRPTWENTIPYAHIQMGVSHAALVYADATGVHNLDMPLDEEYNGDKISSSFDSNHYIETDHLQIVRPRNFDANRAKNLSAWIVELRKNYASIRSKALLKFNMDYSSAKIDKYSPQDSFVSTMARILTGKNTKSTDLTMFCSEYTWAMLALSNCDVNDPELSNETIKDASCVKPVFPASTMVGQGDLPGLIEGPMLLLNELDISLSEKNVLVKKLFTPGKMKNLSRGHRDLANDKMVNMLMLLAQGGKVPLNPTKPTELSDFPGFYPASINGQGSNPMVLGVAQMVNTQGGRNYSPTSFLINAMLDSTNPQRKLDYVATIIFTDKL